MSAEDLYIGQRIKARRKRAGYSLRELASRTELTAAFLSQVERGQVNPSISSLRRIAEALEVSMLSFLAESAQASGPKYSPVVRVERRSKLNLPDSKVTYELLTPDLAHKIEVVAGCISPGTGNVARPLREPTEEWIYVLSGALLITLGSDNYILNPGDTIMFEGAELKTIACASQEDATWISVITPPVF
jgi:transcriptional regulator with XRE-family HTH domain